MKRIAVHLLAVATRRTRLRSRPSYEPLAHPSRGQTSNIRDIRRRLLSGPTKAVSAITAAARLSRFWRRREARRSEGSSPEREGVGQDEATETATTIDTLRDGSSKGDIFIFPYMNPPNSPTTSSVDITMYQLPSAHGEEPTLQEIPSAGLRVTAQSALTDWTVGRVGLDLPRTRDSFSRGALHVPMQRAQSLPTNKTPEQPLSNLFNSLGSLVHMCTPSTSHKSLVASATTLSLSGAGDYLLEPRLPPSPTGLLAKLALPVVDIFSGSASPAASIISILPSPWCLIAVPESIPLLEVKHLVRDAVSLLPTESR